MAESPSFRARKGWSAPATRTFREVLAAHPTLDSTRLAGLYGACDLLSQADKMQAQIDDDGLTVSGSMGQKVAHPLVAEVRQYRRAALDSLKALGLDGRSAASQAGAALAGKRWSSRPPGGNVTPIRGSA